MIAPKFSSEIASEKRPSVPHMCTEGTPSSKRGIGDGPKVGHSCQPALIDAKAETGWDVATRQAISRWRRGRTAHRFLTRARPPENAPAPDENTVALVTALTLTTLA